MFSWVSGQLPAGVFGGSARSDFVRLQSVIFYECTARFAMFRGTRARAFYGELEVAARMRQKIWVWVVFEHFGSSRRSWECYMVGSGCPFKPVQASGQVTTFTLSLCNHDRAVQAVLERWRRGTSNSWH